MQGREPPSSGAREAYRILGRRPQRPASRSSGPDLLAPITDATPSGLAEVMRQAQFYSSPPGFGWHEYQKWIHGEGPGPWD